MSSINSLSYPKLYLMIEAKIDDKTLLMIVSFDNIWEGREFFKNLDMMSFSLYLYLQPNNILGKCEIKTVYRIINETNHVITDR